MLKRSLSIAVLVVTTAATLLHAQQSGDIHLVLTGDYNFHGRLSVYDDPAYLKLFDHIHRADAAFTNIETLIHPQEEYGQAVSGGQWQASPLWEAEELKWAGFNLVGLVNNHVFDYGVDGLRSTAKALDAAGIAHAGSGENLALARQPAYVYTKHGRVALIGAASTFTPGSLASEARPDLPGRPGISPLRFSTTYTVDEPTFKSVLAVKELLGSKQLFGSFPGEAANQSARSAAVQSVTLSFGGGSYGHALLPQDPPTVVLGSPTGVHTEPYKEDVDGLLTSVRTARKLASIVIVSIHAHEARDGDRELPAEFVVTFAHEAIDAGADVFFVHGPHIFRGIEIYKGKPIFYSLGNFAWDASVAPQPAEAHSADRARAEAPAAPKGAAVSFATDEQNWKTAAAEVTFTPDHKLKEIVIDPLSIGWDKPAELRGIPWPPDPALSQSIIEDIQRLSAPFGTRVEFVDGHGVIKLDQ
jgi:poly-gamma-glutamate synthesis protein (capsule biosynthesis protein)